MSPPASANLSQLLMKPSNMLQKGSNPLLNLTPFSHWTLRDKAAQRRLALRWPHSLGSAASANSFAKGARQWIVR